MTDSERITLIEPVLYSIFPAKMNSGNTIWMVNLWGDKDHKVIIHGEGGSLREAIDNAYLLLLRVI